MFPSQSWPAAAIRRHWHKELEEFFFFFSCVSVGFLPGRFSCLIFTLNPSSSSFPSPAKPLGYGRADDALQWPAVAQRVRWAIQCVCVHKLTFDFEHVCMKGNSCMCHCVLPFVCCVQRVLMFLFRWEFISIIQLYCGEKPWNLEFVLVCGRRG